MQVQLNFVVLTIVTLLCGERELMVQRIYLDETFIAAALEKCEQFIKVAIIVSFQRSWESGIQRIPYLNP